ncbi:HAD hydrolase family protein, partial [Rhodococcus sp. CX]|uniref:HAD family hydrolase n=2 Tax=unclassified Rhodococcus (in: high G+C Gram-positive bacteria) TaxID=192944 RepID=UPI0027DCED96
MSSPVPSLVATDVDGTLIDDANRVSERTRAAVHAVVESGTPFVLATGRPPRWIPPVVEELGYAPLSV